MLVFDYYYLCACNVVTALDIKYPKVDGLVHPYRPQSWETEGVTITIPHPIDGHTYRITLCNIVRKGSPVVAIIRLSQFGGDKIGARNRFSPMANRKIVLPPKNSDEDNVAKIVEHIADLLKFIEYPLE